MKTPSDQYERIVYWSEEDETFVGMCPELFFGGVHGDDPNQVFAELNESIAECVAIFVEDGRELPTPKHSLVAA